MPPGADLGIGTNGQRSHFPEQRRRAFRLSGSEFNDLGLTTRETADAERATELLRSLGQPPELMVVLQPKRLWLASLKRRSAAEIAWQEVTASHFDTGAKFGSDVPLTASEFQIVENSLKRVT
jgi:hypothetical protein